MKAIPQPTEKAKDTIVICTNCQCIHALSQRVETTDGLFTLNLCPKCSCESYHTQDNPPVSLTTFIEGEYSREWWELGEDDQNFIIQSYANAFQTKKVDTLKRIFNIGAPVMILGKKDGNAYCRVDASSIMVMGLLIKNYL